DTAGTLHDRLMILGAELVTETLRMIDEGKVETIDQQNLLSDTSTLKKAPKIFREDCNINWNKTPVEICNLIRGLNPVPGAFTQFDDVAEEPFYMKIFHAIPIIQQHDHPTGKLFSDNKTYLKVSCHEGFIDIKTMQPAGRSRMKTADFLRGYDFSRVHPLH
ncbi:MAG: methionyl-tRNA formyltransferase, partial [Bacteroidota bacterium]